MTLFKMTMPQVEVRPPVAPERPSVAQTSAEESARFFKALQKAEANKPAAKPPADDQADLRLQRDHSQSKKEIQAKDEQVKAVKPSQDTQKEPTVAADQAARSGQADKAEKITDFKSDRRRKKGDDDAEAVVLDLPILQPSLLNGGTRNLALGGGVPLAGLGGMPLPPGMGGGVPPGVGGQPPVGTQGIGQGLAVGQIGTVPTPTFSQLVDTMAITVGGKPEALAGLQFHGGDEKPDSSFALRLINNTTQSAAARPSASTQTSLPAHSPTFGEDLAEQVGRLRIVSRPGISEQVRITLHPRELGSMDMRLMVDNQHQVHLLITTDSDAARDQLNRQLPQLREALARQNLGMGEVTVHVNDGKHNETAPEWGFQGDQNPKEPQERSEFMSWREGGMAQGSSGVASVAQPEAVAFVGGGSQGLSLFA